MSTDGIEDLLRPLVPQVLGAVVRRYGHFDLAEDAVQETLIAATEQWPANGTPANPRGWLIRVASRRLTDAMRSEEARRRREATSAALTPRDDFVAPPPGEGRMPSRDDTLTLLFLCCHPSLSPSSQIALTLRAVGGLTTAEIARAYLVPEATMAQRISRAKQSIKADGSRFQPPGTKERSERLRVVMQVLYLIFNEGYTATSGNAINRVDLTDEAIRLTRDLRALVPDDGEVAGLLALMLLTDARRHARTTPYGAIVPLLEQDRRLWNQAYIAEGTALLEKVLPQGTIGPYQLQAAIAAVHDQAPRAEDTDWVEILGLYTLLERVSGDNPVVTLNKAVAVGMVNGPRAGLDVLDGLEADPRLASWHRLPSVRAFLLERDGDLAAAADVYRVAAERATTLAEQRYLNDKARACQA
ncbi:MAG: RNA polymerase sigma factor [Streptosporangiales bacterium]|nr:RNA polymerase sigma factor [Streptosporangiales bacterium]